MASLIENGALVIGDGYRAKNSELGAHGIPFARGGNVNAGFDFNGADLVPPATLARVGVKRSRPGDVVFTSKGTVGRFARVTVDTPEFVYSPQLCFWRATDADVIDARFLYYWIQGPESTGQINALKGQTDMADYVSLRDQRAMAITLPPVTEQRRIAAVLGALDDKIDSNRRLASEVVRLVEVAFARIKRDPAAGTMCLGDLGIVRGGGTPSTKVEAYWEPGEIVWVTPKDMTALEVPVIAESQRLISPAGLANSSARLLPRGSVLYTSRATLGHVAVASTELATNQGFIAIEPDEFSSAFVLMTLRDRNDAIIAKANGSTFLEVNKTNFKAVDCVRPSQLALEEFDEVAGPAMKKVAALERETKALRAIRDELLPKLVSGEIRVTDGDEGSLEVAA